MSLSAREELQKTALLSNEGGLMLKWNAVSDRADEDLMVQMNREQDDEFCRKLLAALRAGKETCPVGVSTEPGTKRPNLAIIDGQMPESTEPYVGFPSTADRRFALRQKRTDVDANYAYH